MSGTGRVAVLAGSVLRYGLTAILLYFGAFKFTAVEAEAIRPLIANSPPLAWLYTVTTVQRASSAIGVAEIAIGLLIALGAVAPRLGLLGGLGAVAMFLTTLSFLVTTPGMWSGVPGFPLPVPSAEGAFILKDVFLLGAALGIVTEARHR